MIKTIGSQPEAAKFRSIAAIIIILICMASFLVYTESLSKEASKIAKERVLTDIKYSLAMMLYDYTIKGKQEDLKKFHLENPFVPLAIYRSIPYNYHGVIDEVSSVSEQGWYFEKSSKKAVFINYDDKKEFYSMQYESIVLDKSGQLVLK